jgi:hypothetical protein
MNQPSKPSDPASDNAVGQFSHAHVGILMQLDRLSTLPALLAPARMAQDTAQRVVDFFREAVFEHHQDEEKALFPALLESAHAGEERQRVNTLVDALTAEHREIEGLWRQLEPELKHVAQGRSYHINAPVLDDLVSRYQAHAQVEETQLLPLADTILGRHGNHMAALGLSLHMRHQPPPIGHI